MSLGHALLQRSLGKWHPDRIGLLRVRKRRVDARAQSAESVAGPSCSPHHTHSVLEPLASSPVALQLLSHVQLFANPWTAARQASLSFTISWSSLKFVSVESLMSSNHLVLCRPLLILPSIFPSIRIFTNESALCITWPKYWSFSFSISPSNEYSGLISFMNDWFDLVVQGTQESFPIPRFKSINSSALCLFYGPSLICIHDY